MSKFTKAIERNWPDYTIAPGTSHKCDECTQGVKIGEDDIKTLQTYDKGSFSWVECDSCGVTLGGSRYNAHAIHKEAFAKQPDNVHHVNICTDCLMYHANGDEPENWE